MICEVQEDFVNSKLSKQNDESEGRRTKRLGGQWERQRKTSIVCRARRPSRENEERVIEKWGRKSDSGRDEGRNLWSIVLPNQVATKSTLLAYFCLGSMKTVGR